MLWLAALLALFAIALLAIKPRWGILALFVVRPIVDVTWAQTLVGDFKLTEIVSVAVPGLMILRMCLPGAPAASFSRMPLRWAWLLWSLYVAVFSIHMMLASDLREGANIFFRHLNGLAGFYMVQAYLADDRGSQRFAMAMAVAGIFPIGTGLYEIVTGNHWSIVYGEGGLVRNVGMYHDAITPRYYAMQTILALLVLTVLYRSRRWLANLAAVLYGGACAVVVFFAYSKSGALTLASWSLAWAGLMRRGRVLGLIAVLGLGAAVTFNDTVTDRLGTLFNKEIGVLRGETATDRSFAGRWYIWFDLIDEWQRQDSTQQIFGSGRSALGAHNDYLQILMHGGLVGLALYLLLLLTLLGAVLRDLLQRRDAWTVAALLAMIMWLVDTIGLIPSAYSNYQWFVWGVIGLSMRRMRNERSASRSRVAAAQEPPVFASQHECQPSISAL